jgi:AraC-like DNA-binding protein
MRILSASGVDATLLMCRGWPDLIGFASEAPGLCVAIVDPYDGDMLVSEELIGDACRLARGRGCIIYATFDGRPAGDVAKLVRLGIRDVVTRHVDDSPHRIAAAIRESLGMVKLEEMVAAPVSALTVHQQTIVRWSIRRGTARMSVSELAEVLGTSTRTLGRWCGGLPQASTSTLLAWGRVLHACRLLSHTTMSLETIAESLDFSSVGDLRRKFYRVTQARLTDVDRGDALELVVQALRAIALDASA